MEQGSQRWQIGHVARALGLEHDEVLVFEADEAAAKLAGPASIAAFVAHRNERCWKVADGRADPPSEDEAECEMQIRLVLAMNVQGAMRSVSLAK